MHKTLLAAAIALAVSTGSLAAAPANSKEPLDAHTLDPIRSDFRKLMELANRHDFQALHEMFWQSPTTLLVAKNAIPSEGDWAGFWGNEAIDQKVHDIGTSGPVVLEPDYSKLDKSREGLEGRLRDHPASASGARRQRVGSTRCLWRATKCDEVRTLEPLFTQDSRQVDDLQILIGMVVIRDINERYEVRSFSHGIGFDAT